MSDYVLVEGEEMITVFLCNEESKSIFFQIFFFQYMFYLKMGLINFLNKQNYFKYTDIQWLVLSL